MYPSGTVTLMFTDIEGSTRLWESDREAMAYALHRHDTLLREVIEAAGGFVFKTAGDGFCAAFASAESAIEAATTAQRRVLPRNSSPKSTTMTSTWCAGSRFSLRGTDDLVRPPQSSNRSGAFRWAALLNDAGAPVARPSAAGNRSRLPLLLSDLGFLWWR